jgi:RNA polymerase sigma-70 factor (ECF subfamily)
LLQRLRGEEPGAWRRLLDLYGPTVQEWCRQAGLSREDAADVAQESFQSVARHIVDFRRDRPGDSFRGWLWTITRHKILDQMRRNQGQVKAVGGSSAQERLLQVPGDNPDESYPQQGAALQDLYRRALRLIQTEFEERTWRAFWRLAVEGQLPAEVAGALGMSRGAVYVAKSRVLKRLRDEFAELL